MTPALPAAQASRALTTLAFNSTATSCTMDITAPQAVEIHIRHDGLVVWVNVDGICRFRACQIGELAIIDDRVEYE
jgi:hypothetical protein